MMHVVSRTVDANRNTHTRQLIYIRTFVQHLIIVGNYFYLYTLFVRVDNSRCNGIIADREHTNLHLVNGLPDLLYNYIPASIARAKVRIGTRCIGRGVHQRTGGINLSGRERYSVPFFFTGNPDVVVECLPNCLGPGESPQYPPVTVEQHLAECYRRTYV